MGRITKFIIAILAIPFVISSSYSLYHEIGKIYSVDSNQWFFLLGIIVEEQLGRNLTLTYATNVNTTGQQLIQAEVAINRNLSLLVARDESGVFSMVIKATRRFH